MAFTFAPLAILLSVPALWCQVEGQNHWLLTCMSHCSMSGQYLDCPSLFRKPQPLLVPSLHSEHYSPGPSGF